MTIYAIVNSLLPPSEKINCDSPLWTVISSSAILQGGNPYFVPDFSGNFEARPALALRIGKLGKSIAPRFVSRYVDAIAPASVMIAPDLLDSLRERGLPWSAAISYDRSIAIGKFEPCLFEKIGDRTISLSHISEDGESIREWSITSLSFSIEDTISTISRDNTLKTGDLVLTGICTSGPSLSPGQRVVMSVDGQPSLKFNIR